ncbi:CRP-like cAMP-binding protein [Chitinophaga niastensis]|uniref:CRP-like cAMP-binding protein n=1 Tax=Chitinophaga niastensis TaxID=536980 RepID=A0A2P8HMB5_CHINA|nr:Crp/Fnr family transcriptional regulator [Chitinophaga niastensis]PSL47351.1 CRP-like cAMP-binding protein [Chitinophaga niastensis]
MYEQLKIYCTHIVPLTDQELDLIETHFDPVTIKKKGFLLEEGKACPFIVFIAKGIIRHFHTKDGIEKTCDISFENSWVTDFESFNNSTASKMNLQALEETTAFVIRKEALLNLYKACSKYETLGRLMAEQVAQRATGIAMSLSSEKPAERFNNLIKNQPDLLQKVPQKYIANFLGISPESLSRIRSRMLPNRKS